MSFRLFLQLPLPPPSAIIYLNSALLNSSTIDMHPPPARALVLITIFLTLSNKYSSWNRFQPLSITSWWSGVVCQATSACAGCRRLYVNQEDQLRKTTIRDSKSHHLTSKSFLTLFSANMKAHTFQEKNIAQPNPLSNEQDSCQVPRDTMESWCKPSTQASSFEKIKVNFPVLREIFFHLQPTVPPSPRPPPPPP